MARFLIVCAILSMRPSRAAPVPRCASPALAQYLRRRTLAHVHVQVPAAGCPKRGPAHEHYARGSRFASYVRGKMSQCGISLRNLSAENLIQDAHLAESAEKIVRSPCSAAENLG